jgi:hypothetical protein
MVIGFNFNQVAWYGTLRPRHDRWTESGFVWGDGAIQPVWGMLWHGYLGETTWCAAKVIPEWPMLYAYHQPGQRWFDEPQRASMLTAYQRCTCPKCIHCYNAMAT